MHRQNQKTVAIMQPYFLPYLGYFSLLDRADELVLLDCVQFPRRGRVHRSQLEGRQGRWLTLPLQKAPRETKIHEMKFSPTAQSILKRRLENSPLYKKADVEVQRFVGELLDVGGRDLTGYLTVQINALQRFLNIECRVTRSSSLEIPQALKSQDRIIAIAKKVEATRYINAPGGRNLYRAEAFAAENLELVFLPPYQGENQYLLPSLLSGRPEDMFEDLVNYKKLELVK